METYIFSICWKYWHIWIELYFGCVHGGMVAMSYIRGVFKKFCK